MFRFVLTALLFVTVSLQASVPEPSFVLYGQIQSAGQQVKQDGMMVSASYGSDVLADILLNASNSHRYTLEIPLEAAVGARDAKRARVGDIVQIKVAGQLAASVQIDERGSFKQLNIELPQGFDTDKDGILDAQEVQNGTNPNNPNDPVKFGNQDIDGDGISNGAEFLTGTYLPDGDADGDGYSNQDEYELATDPNSGSKFPKQYPGAGNYSALHVHSAAFSYLKAVGGADLIWDEAVNGKPVSLVPAYWNIDTRIDYLVSTSQGKLFTLIQNAQGQFEAPVLISLFSVPTGGDLMVGFANVNGNESDELWAFSKVSNQLYVYKREPKGVPYGKSVWKAVAVAGIAGQVQLNDLDGDGVVDLLASGVDLSVTGKTAANTIAFKKGSWDGINYSLGSNVLVTSQAHINNSRFIVLDNIVEAGFDKKKDLLIRGNDQKFYVDLSYNRLKKGAIAESLLQMVATAQTANDGVVLSGLLAQLNTATADDVYTIGQLNADANNTMDLLQYTGTMSGASYKFRLVPGAKSTRDQDLDGIHDYKDVALADPNKPLPKGNLDFDGDNIPYGIDGNRSGLEDADGDGMTDGFEIYHGLNPNDASDKNSDLDADGRTAHQEFREGTNPNDASSVATLQARLLSSLRAFDNGASDMLVRGNEVVVASQNSKEVKLFNTADYKASRSFQTSDKNGVSKLLSLNNLLIIGNVGGSIEVWDANAAARLIKFDRSSSSVTDMAVDGTSLYSLHANGDVYHWNIQALTYVSHWHVYDGFLTNIHANGDLIYIQASAPQKMMFVWDVRTQSKVYTITGNADCCTKVVSEFTSGKMIVANSFSDAGIYEMNTQGFNSQEVVQGVDASVVRVLNGANANREIYVGRKSGVIDRYSVKDGSFVGRVAAPYTHVRDIELINGGFISLHSDGKIYFWEHN